MPERVAGGTLIIDNVHLGTTSTKGKSFMRLTSAAIFLFPIFLSTVSVAASTSDWRYTFSVTLDKRYSIYYDGGDFVEGPADDDEFGVGRIAGPNEESTLVIRNVPDGTSPSFIREFRIPFGIDRVVSLSPGELDTIRSEIDEFVVFCDYADSYADAGCGLWATPREDEFLLPDELSQRILQGLDDFYGYVEIEEWRKPDLTVDQTIFDAESWPIGHPTSSFRFRTADDGITPIFSGVQTEGGSDWSFSFSDETYRYRVPGPVLEEGRVDWTLEIDGVPVGDALPVPVPPSATLLGSALFAAGLWRAARRETIRRKP